MPKIKYRAMSLTNSLRVAPIDVDKLHETDSIKIQANGLDTILWFSGTGSLFKIPKMAKKSGPGPKQPFPHNFSNNDPFQDHIDSGPAIKCDKHGVTTYKYTVTFKQGGQIDPSVDIQQ